jgi:hypothetical protein
MGLISPISSTGFLRRSQSAMTLNVNNTTGSIVMFTVTGSVLIRRLFGEVTTVISSAHTNGHIRTNDQSATIDLSNSTGATLSALAVGTMIWRAGVLATALAIDDNAVGAINDALSAGNDCFSPFIITKKNGAVTTLDYRYTTTNAPSTGAILWTADWEPLSVNGNLA